MTPNNKTPKEEINNVSYNEKEKPIVARKAITPILTNPIMTGSPIGSRNLSVQEPLLINYIQQVLQETTL